jgi:hypothetical protein
MKHAAHYRWVLIVTLLAACSGEPRLELSGETSEQMEQSFRKSFAAVRQRLPPADQERLRSILFFRVTGLGRFYRDGAESALNAREHDEMVSFTRRDFGRPWADFLRSFGTQLSWTSHDGTIPASNTATELFAWAKKFRVPHRSLDDFVGDSKQRAFSSIPLVSESAEALTV